MLLYDSTVSGNCYKARWILALRGLEYERVELSVIDRSNRAEVIGDRNPARRVPTLVFDDGRTLGESNAILWHFGEGTPLVPEDPFERAQVLQWMFFEQYDHEPNIAVARFHRHVLGQQPQEQAMAGGRRALEALERHLTTRAFLVGERFTIADMALYAYTHVAPEGGFDLASYPAVREWLARVSSQPGHVTLD